MKLKGAKIALLSFGSALAFAAANKLADGALTGIVDQVSGSIRPPTFLIVFSDRVDVSGLRLLYDGMTPLAVKDVQAFGERALRVKIAPGYYILQLRRNDDGVVYVLSAPINLRTSSSDYSVDVSESKWAPESATTHIEGTSPGTAPTLSGTHWVLSQSDLDVAGSAPSDILTKIAKTALGQLGVYENGSDADKKAITGYFMGTNITVGHRRCHGEVHS